MLSLEKILDLCAFFHVISSLHSKNDAVESWECFLSFFFSS
uniref:Uncharacterized protein n=1 Tax=Anguilla anguilla TaxID=7936 RepID=A0A0E9WQH7_ANGAN